MSILKRARSVIVVRRGRLGNYLTAMEMLIREYGYVVLHADRRYVGKALRLVVSIKERIRVNIAVYKYYDDGSLTIILKSTLS